MGGRGVEEGWKRRGFLVYDFWNRVGLLFYTYKGSFAFRGGISSLEGVFRVVVE